MGTSPGSLLFGELIAVFATIQRQRALSNAGQLYKLLSFLRHADVMFKGWSGHNHASAGESSMT